VVENWEDWDERMGIDYELKQESTLKLGLKLNQNVKLGLEILQKPILDLFEFVKREVAENPFLEFEKELNVESVDIDPERYVRPFPKTLRRFLHEQLDFMNLDDEDHLVISFIIDNLDEKGFLPHDVEELAEDLEIPAEIVEKNLRVLKGKFEPLGCGSRNLLDYLRNFLNSRELETVLNCVSSKRKIPETVKSKLRGIPPYPSWGFESDEPIVPIIPEILIEKKDGSMKVELREMLRLRMNEELEKFVKSDNWKPKEYSRAKLILTFLGKRKELLYRIGCLLLERQREFLLGMGELKPLTLTETAEILRLNVSTVSRAVSGKYIHTPVGTFKLRDLFRRVVGKNRDLSTYELEKEIRDILSANGKVSDNVIRKELERRGIYISRRTVTKYRLKLGIRRRERV